VRRANFVRCGVEGAQVILPVALTSFFVNEPLGRGWLSM
jgi:hypothetical protein